MARNENGLKRGRGRPSSFRPEFCEQVVKLCRLGATDRQIAEFFGVVESTVNLWKLEHPEFSESIKEGKVQADMQVADALFKTATGYVIETEKVLGKGDNARVEKLKVSVPGDTTAQIFWLKNRQRDHWRDKTEAEVTGADGAPLIPGINLTINRRSKSESHSTK